MAGQIILPAFTSDDNIGRIWELNQLTNITKAYSNDTTIIGKTNSSADYIKYTSTYPHTFENSNTLNYGESSSANNVFFKFWNAGTTQKFYSTNGINWSACTGLTQNTQYFKVVYGNGIYVTYGGNYWATSVNGINWTVSTSTYNQYATYLPTDIVFGNGIFVCSLSNGSSCRIITSTNGLTWTERTSALTKPIDGLAFGNGKFVAIGHMTTAIEKVTQYSVDGITWTASPDNTPLGYWTDVTFGNGAFVAVSSSYVNDNNVMISKDGINWSGVTGYPYCWQTVCFCPKFKNFVAAGLTTNQYPGPYVPIMMTSLF